MPIRRLPALRAFSGRARACVLLPALAAPALLLSTAAPAPAATPGMVTVRVLGAAPNYEALTPLTQVTTTAATFTKYGGSCSGTSAAAALDLATAGHWEGSWNQGFGDYEVTAIDGLSFPFQSGASANQYWAFWPDYKEAQLGVCNQQLNPGDEALFFPACYGTGCPPVPSVLDLRVPAVVEARTAITVSVIAHTPEPEGKEVEQPAAGVVVSGGGVSAETDAAGQATLTFAGAGSYVLHAGHSGSVPGEALICVHAGDDGTCGTPMPSAVTNNTPPAPPTETATSPTPVIALYTGPYALVAQASDPVDNHTYGRHAAPRELAGTITAHSRVTSVSIRLRRTWHGHCWAYDGTQERLVRVRCRSGSFFKLQSASASFRYLLPRRLPPGRYVFDIAATDAAGNSAPLDRGSSRIVFYVR